jgi:hypothetical protein
VSLVKEDSAKDGTGTGVAEEEGGGGGGGGRESVSSDAIGAVGRGTGWEADSVKGDAVRLD